MTVPSLVELGDPTPAPSPTTKICTDCAWAGTGGDYLAVALNGSPGLRVYTRTGDTLDTPLTIPGTGFTSVVAVDWSPDGSILVALAAGTRIVVYSRTGSTLSVVSDTPGSGLTQQFFRFSPDGAYAVRARAGTSGAKNVELFTHAAGTLTLVATQSVGAGSEGFTGVAWSPNGSYIATVLRNGDEAGIRLVKRVGSTLSFVDTEPITNGAGTESGVVWLDDTTLLVAVRHTTLSTNILRVYTRTGDTINAGTSNAGLTTGTILGAAAVRAQDNSVALGWNAELHLAELTATETLTDTAPTYPTIATTQAFALRWTADGNYVALAENNTTTDGFQWWKVGEVTVIPPLRQRQRNDGLAAGRVRQRVGNAPTSRQNSIRQGWANTYL